jgi:hypothetical protein
MLKHLKQSNIYKYLVAAVLLSVPLYPKFPLFDVPGTFVSIRLEDFIIAIGLIYILINEKRKVLILFRNKLVQAMLIFLFVGFVSLISAVFVTKTVSLHLGFLHWARRFEYFIPFFLGLYALKKTDMKTDFIIKLLLIVVFFAFVYGFGQKNFSWPIIITQNEEYSQGVALKWIPGSHINSSFAGHYDLATFLIMVLPIFINSVFIFKKKVTKVVLILAIFSGLWLLVNSASRISILSYIIASSLSLLLIKKYKYIPIIIAISVAFIGFSSNLLTRYGRIINVVREKIVYEVRENNVVYAVEDVGKLPSPTPVPVTEDRSTSIRLNVEWPRAIRSLKKNLLLGTGYSSITLATDNDYLRALGEIGILGFFAFSLLFIRVVRVISKPFPYLKNFKTANLAFITGFAGALAGIFVNAFFIDIFEASKFATIFWLFVGIAVSLIYETKIEQDN